MQSRKSVWIARACLTVGGGLIAGRTQAAEPEAKEPIQQQQSGYTKRGADTCLKCHDESSKFPVLSIFKTKHAQPADSRTPFATLQCETCHGPGAQHAEEVPEGQKQAPIVKFGASSQVPIEKQNQICLGCHENQARIAWNSSPHGGNDVACASCHQIHAAHDSVLSNAQQPDVCYACHKVQRAEFTSHRCTPCALRKWRAAPATRCTARWQQSCCSSPR